jgi:hypothetical protein
LAVFCVMSQEPPAARGKGLRTGANERGPAAGVGACGGAERLGRGVRRITAADAERFLEMRGKARPEDRQAMTEQWHQLLERWASAAPQEAAEFLEKHGMLALPAPDALPVLKAWARGDAVSVLDWVKAGGDARKNWWNQSRYTFARAWMEHDPKAARAWVDAGGSDGMESSIVSGMFQSATRETIAAWLKQHSAGDAKISPVARDTAVQLLAGQHLKQDGADAALAWAESLQRPDELVSATQMIVTSLTASAPEKAVQWLARQPASTSGQHTAWQARDAMMKWTSGDPVAAGEWLNTHRDSPAASAFIEAYAMGIAGDDPAASRQWIAQLPDTPVPTAIGGDWLLTVKPPPRAALEHMVSLAEISRLSLDDPAQAVALAGALPGNATPGLTNYHLTLVREAPGERPVPCLTAVSPFV